LARLLLRCHLRWWRDSCASLLGYNATDFRAQREDLFLHLLASL
jgi:hypothetical protein